MGTRVAHIAHAVCFGIAPGRRMRIVSALCALAGPIIRLELAGFASLAGTGTRGILVLACLARRARASVRPAKSRVAQTV
jgi:hypothetical protein